MAKMYGDRGISNFMQVTRTPGASRNRLSYTLVAPTAEVDYAVHNGGVDNVIRAILERVFFVKSDQGFAIPPKPNGKLFNRRLAHFCNQFSGNVRVTTPMTYTEFVSSYSGRQAKVYQRAVESLLTIDWKPKDSNITAFVKVEKTDLTSKPDPAPRIIQPRHPRFNAAIGVYIKKIEKRIYKNIATVFGHETVMKGMAVDEVAKTLREKWDMFKRPVAIGLDASRFDQHVSRVALEWEHEMYRKYFPHSKRLRAMLKCQLKNNGFSHTPDGTVKYSVDGCRMSGDMNTGLGNSLLMSAMVYSFYKERGCTISLANNGDDCVVFCEQEDLWHLDALPAWFTQMGFTMKVEAPVTVFEKIEFCQMQPVYTGYEWLMVRKPSCALVKDCVSFKSITNIGAWKYYCQAISDGGMALYGHMPVFKHFYQMLNVGGKHGKFTWRDGGLHAWGAPKNHGSIEGDIRHSFYLAFDITPDEQRALEDYYTRVVPSYTVSGEVNNGYHSSTITHLLFKIK